MKYTAETVFNIANEVLSMGATSEHKMAIASVDCPGTIQALVDAGVDSKYIMNAEPGWSTFYVAYRKNTGPLPHTEFIQAIEKQYKRLRSIQMLAATGGLTLTPPEQRFADDMTEYHRLVRDKWLKSREKQK